MKKTLLTIAVAIASFLGVNMQATAQTTKTYTDYLTVSIEELGFESAPQETNVDVIVNEDGTMNLTLKNFILMMGDTPLPVGNIAVTNLELKNSKYRSYKTFHRSETIMLENGDLDLYPEWLASQLNEMGGVPIDMDGQINNDKLYVTIDIYMEALGQTIKVVVGEPLVDVKPDNCKEYTFDLTVAIEELGFKSEPQPANVLVFYNEDGTMDLTLTNFVLMMGDTPVPVGNIAVSNLTLTPSKYGTYNTFERTETIMLENGDLELYPEWLAPQLNEMGGVPIILNGQIDDEKLYVTIDIYMEALGQTIKVIVGEPWEETAPVTHTLTFIVDGETISTEDVAEGATVTAPEVTEREGYTFAWTDEVPETMPGEDVTINGSYTANKYKVTFKVGDDIVFQEEMEYGATITVPEIEEREGYTFYWRTEAPANVPAEDVEAYGEYVINQYWVQIIVDGEAIYEQLQDYGTPVVVPEVEEREGYTFAWDTEIPETVPAEDVLVHGNYTVNQYTITFMLDGQVYAEYTLDYGAEITAPEVTGDERYSFGGWEDVPETVPAHDVIIYGGMVDGVTKIENGKLKVENCYNLAGMRFNLKHAHGIIIVDGKKVFKKY